MATALNDIHLFERILPHIGCPEPSGFGVKTEAPGVAEAIGIDFFPEALGVAGKRIICRDAVIQAFIQIVNIGLPGCQCKTTSTSSNRPARAM